VLQSDNLFSVNSFAEPQKIAPKETDMTIKGTRIELVAAPYSVSVLRVKLM